MEGDTLRSKISQLLQRTRKAVRLYGSVDRSGSSGQSGLTVQQLEVWQAINSQLQRELIAVLENPNYKILPSNLRSIRDRYFNDWRTAQTEVRSGQKELVTAAERGDFVRTAVLSQKLIQFKAREQACHAVVHELEQVVDKNSTDKEFDLPDVGSLDSRQEQGLQRGTGSKDRSLEDGDRRPGDLNRAPTQPHPQPRSNVIHLRARNSGAR